MNEFLQVSLLGILQGATEFLPVSSSGHLALAGLLFNIEEAGLTLNVLLHAGTFLATAIVLRHRLGAALFDGVPALAAPSRFRTTAGGQDALFIIVASIPTAIIGLTLRDLVDQWTSSPLVVGLGFVLTTFLLLVTKVLRPGGLEYPSALIAVVAGVAQGFSVIPGISRSGATIAALLLFGVQRRRSFELSMLMSLPAVLGAVALELPRMLQAPSGVAFPLLGMLVAFATGVMALLTLRRVVVSGGFWAFALWVGPLAVATLAMARAWPH